MFGLAHALPPLMHPMFERFVPAPLRAALPVGWRWHETVDVCAPLVLVSACFQLLFVLCEPNQPTHASVLALALSAVVFAQGMNTKAQSRAK